MHRLIEIVPAASADRVLLRFAGDGGGDDEILNVSCETLVKYKLEKGNIDDFVFYGLCEISEFERAVLKGLNVLGYGANSKKSLFDKLCRAGFSRASAEKAVSYLSEKQYLNEEKDALRICEGLIKKKYGRRKILSALYSKGYRNDVISIADEYLSETDFVALCEEAIKRKFGDVNVKKIASDPKETQKALAKLVALGYNVSEAKSAWHRTVSKDH